MDCPRPGFPVLLHSPYIVNLHSLFILHNWNFVPFDWYPPPPPPRQPQVPGSHHSTLCSIILAILDSTYKWDHVAFLFLCLVYFTYHNIFWVHPDRATNGRIPFLFVIIEVWLIYNIVLASDVQQSDSGFVFSDVFDDRLLLDIEYNSLCYSAGLCCYLFYI